MAQLTDDCFAFSGPLMPIAEMERLIAERVQPVAEAERWYQTGTDALRDGAYYQASKAFEQAIRIDDQYALAHARLVEAWMELDYTDRAKDEMLRVGSLVGDRSALPQLDRLYLDAIIATVPEAGYRI